MTVKKQIKVTLLGSRFGRLKTHRDCIRGLGLRRIRQSVILEDTPCVRGMINRVSYLVQTEELN